MKFDLARSSIRSRPPNRCRNSLLVRPFILLGAGGQILFSRASIGVGEPSLLSSTSYCVLSCFTQKSDEEISRGECQKLKEICS